MTPYPTAADGWITPLFAVAGMAFGRAYFATLRRGVAAYAAGGAVRGCVGWLLARLIAAALFFAFAVHWGAWPLLAAFLGFLAARWIAVRAARRVT
jgi:hypothetical protein